MKKKKKQPKPTSIYKDVKIDAKLIKNEEWLTTEEVLKHLNISRSTLFRLRKTHQIIDVKIGCSPMFPKSLLNKMLLLKSIRNFNKE
ncbi:helix-turn-helix domain-containing protein [Polaribacter sp. Hel_I_88]|uniref:helix-turn-helix domain-containing protein n=1 Tax=Polaribacter sp. Hel_I_88 TaxID=1250006 RepID=UPI00047CF239|nr:helix-turn-helix domain-containing protein [Polaribacter sp. Hel_I_88]